MRAIEVTFIALAATVTFMPIHPVKLLRNMPAVYAIRNGVEPPVPPPPPPVAPDPKKIPLMTAFGGALAVAMIWT